MKSFLDSGAHTLLNRILKKGTGAIDYSFYRTDEFWKYVDAYAKFIKKNADCFDLYANVDSIRNPKMSWEVQQYLEKEHGLQPIPVVHYNTPIRWIDHYLQRGHKYLALGGPIKRQGKIYHYWADKAWNAICQGKDHYPLARVHGFSVTTHAHIVRYPWWSVDSVTWKKMAYYGQILVPQKRKGRFDFSIPNLVIFVDPTTSYAIQQGKKKRHFLQLPGRKIPKFGQRAVREWLDFIGVPFGRSRKDGSIIECGVSNDEIVRRAATIQYYLHLCKSLPRWPWPFHKSERNDLTELL